MASKANSPRTPRPSYSYTLTRARFCPRDHALASMRLCMHPMVVASGRVPSPWSLATDAATAALPLATRRQSWRWHAVGLDLMFCSVSLFGVSRWSLMCGFMSSLCRWSLDDISGPPLCWHAVGLDLMFLSCVVVWGSPAGV